MSEPAETPPQCAQQALSLHDWPDWNDWRINPPIPSNGRESLQKTLNEFTRDLVWNPFELSAQFNALQGDYSARFCAALQSEAATVLKRLSLALCEPDTQRVLRNVAAWAEFRHIPSTRPAGMSYGDWLIARGTSMNENTTAPLLGMRLYLVTATLASALSSNDGHLKRLALTLCKRFVAKSKLTGHWAPIFEVLATEGHVVYGDGSGKPFPRLYESRGYLTDSARVRLKLYWQHHQGPLNVLRLISSVAYLPAISWQIKSREIRRFLEVRQRIGQAIAPLRLRHIEWLREREFRLLVRRPELLEALIESSDSIHSAADELASAKNIIEQRAAEFLELYPLVERALQGLRRAINIRHWPNASEYISKIKRLNPPRRWIYLQLRFAGCEDKGRLDHVPEMITETWSKRGWQAMPKPDFEWLAEHVCENVLERMQIGISPWLDVQEATTKLIACRDLSDKVTPLEKQLLFNAMTEKQWRSIDASGRVDLLMDNGPLWVSYDLNRALLLAARSGCGEATAMHRAGQLRSMIPLLRDMATAQAEGRYIPEVTRLLSVVLKGRSAMGKDTAQPWYLPFIGVPAWRAIERHFEDVHPTLTDALHHAKAKGRIYYPRGYFKRLQQWNTEIGQIFPVSLFDTWCELGRMSPEQAFKQLPANQARVLLADIDECPALLANLPHLFHLELEADILVARACRTQEPEALWSLLTHAKWKYRPHKDSKQVRLPSQITWLAGDTKETLSEAKLDLHIAFLRQDPHSLKHLVKHVQPEQLEAALWRVSQQISETHQRDAAFLQMLALLGADIATQLSALLAQANKALHARDTAHQALGHTLDSLYESKSIPKRNGKTRTLRIPHPMLKCVQKRIAQRVLEPLGAHRCATGFLKDISIADNALPHTHQPVVASCDIRNCFPSVPARKVWHALSRDLLQFKGRTLSTIAIRWLTQICCAHGGLPIGAPTSPALLNRVLFELDETLKEKAAELDCRYTRYADDLCFSGSNDCVKLIGHASYLLKGLGLELDPEKTNIFRRGRRQMVTGLCVNEGINIPRAQRRLLRAAIHRSQVIDQAAAQGLSTEALPKPFLNGNNLNQPMLQGHVAWHAFIGKKRHVSLQ
jgi:retron-type reverse transcriptase